MGNQPLKLSIKVLNPLLEPVKILLNIVFRWGSGRVRPGFFGTHHLDKLPPPGS
ncbi:hypothetical protein [Nodosilinea sp. LEGE 07298]|uniref:hypothetical protein n=1 Tax=Nodosilinea sp. LEGE 07298 TaxID=2777970 RepID=UPI001D14E106|nr:hypothetical protein [Nodosilinea sp. LEGE 07298]